MGPKLSVAVIGGGWAGLAAAVELAAAGHKVSLFEAGKQLGGRARRIESNGHALDNGQHILIGAYRETLRLMRAVGASPDRLLKRLPLELNYPGAGFRLRLPRLPTPFNLALGLMTAKGCTLNDKIWAIRFLRYLQARDYQLLADSTVTGLLDAHRQRGSLRRYLWEPLCVAALNTTPQDASAQIFANVLRDSLGGSRADTDLLLPATDLDQLFPCLASEFILAHGGSIQCSTRIERIDPQLTIRGNTYDRIILAVAPQHAMRLLASHEETAAIAKMLDSYTYEPIGTAYAGYPPDVRLPCPMLGLDGGMNGKLGQWVFDRGILVGTPGVLSFVLSAHGLWDERADPALVASLHGELEEALGKTLPQPLWHRVIRERRATFSCRPDLPRPAAQTPLGGLWLAGDYTCADYPATLESAVRSGIAAARGACGGLMS